ncbi:tetratricopeptide repeat protein [Desulfovibrio aerotolerans]|uniref:Tetratricopeptide repeat protein n=1 Tax=Solidesulfovibrio aerotolerans TaxID=295255 RepID=A0A7C9MIW4_9BACT|nr:tetratricopeptide repeat protein [Solidesulfovibrio aerotolerans]MYL82949.1 tetratricopeptide repeat protein [Solidesulfovibrio aerotolerans]
MPQDQDVLNREHARPGFPVLADIQRVASATQNIPFTAFGSDFDEPVTRITAQGRLEPMLRHLRQGDQEGALRAVESLCRKFPGYHFYLVEKGVQLAALNRLDEATEAFDTVLQRNPTHFQALKYKALVAFLQGDAGGALELFSQSLRQQPGDLFANLNYSMIKRAILPRSRDPRPVMPRTVLCTSLPPRNFERSRLAVSSWLERGFTVFSVNTQAEADILAPHFPEVAFHLCETTAREKFGKDFQYLSTAMECLAASGGEVVGIVNADIVMRGTREDWAAIAASGRTAFTYGPRVNMHNLSDNHGWVHEPGADIFFFPPEFARQVPASEYALGLPWWDIFLPNWAMASGFPIAYIYSPVAMHEYHPINWDFNLYYDFGLYTIRRFFAPMLGELVAANPGRNLYLRKLVAAVAFTAKRTPRGVATPLVCTSDVMRRAKAPIDPMQWIHLEYDTLVVF